MRERENDRRENDGGRDAAPLLRIEPRWQRQLRALAVLPDDLFVLDDRGLHPRDGPCVAGTRARRYDSELIRIGRGRPVRWQWASIASR